MFGTFPVFLRNTFYIFTSYFSALVTLYLRGVLVPLKLLISGIKCIFISLKQQPGAKYLGKNLIGTFGLQRQSWYKPLFSLSERMNLGSSLLEDRRKMRALLKCQKAHQGE